MAPTSRHNAAELVAADHPFYERVDELVVTRGHDVVARLPCERLLLPRDEPWPSHHVGGHVARRRDGSLQALVHGGEAAMLWDSADGGVTWQGRDLDVPGAGAFTVLADDSLLLACGGGTEAVRLLHSADGGSWAPRGRIEPGLFDALHIDSNLLRLRAGSLRLAVNLRLEPPGAAPLSGQYPQYLLRSDDDGASWTGPGDPAFWEAVRRGEARVEDDGPGYVWPGAGGTFPGVYETGFVELRDGRMLGAFRFSGPPRAWHRDVLTDWGEPPEAPDAHGRLFRHIVLGESGDGGRSWGGLRPVVEADGRPLMSHGECNGELVQLGDGRLVLVHQTRYAEAFDRPRHFRGRSTLSARVSDNGGRSWRPERWRLLFGFGYSGTVALADDTLVTVTGCCLGDNGEPRRAAVVRWRVD